MIAAENRPFYLFLLGWTLLNLLQAYGTGLDPDEAYYWMYARHLDWGYFDHPPAIALSIRAGYALLTDELGVRLGTVLLQTASFYCLWILAGRPQDPRRLLLLVLLLVAMPMLEVYGFIATPDGPLLFFTTLFFLFYRRFRQRETWFNTLMLGLCMAALLYSKYHGILIIGLTALSSFSLWRQPRFYIASAFGALLFAPHLYWQYAHDFPSFRYHLQGRDDPYELKHTLNYLVNQLVIFNPLLLPFLGIALVRKKWSGSEAERKLERAFYFIIIGFWIFFFWTTFKGHAEPQWTAVLSFPLLLIAFQYAAGKSLYSRWLQRVAFAGFLLLLSMRSIILFGWMEIPALNFQKKDWPERLQAFAEGHPILFINSYRDPSVFAFYTGGDAYAYNTVLYRANQYDIWNREVALHGRRVLIAAPVKRVEEDPVLPSVYENCIDCLSFQAPGIEKSLKWVDRLQVFHEVTIGLDKNQLEEANWNARNEIRLRVAIENPYDHSVQFGEGNLPLQAVALFQYAPEEWTFTRGSLELPSSIIAPKEKVNTTFTFSVPAGLKDNFDFGVGLKMGHLPPSLHSPLIKQKMRKTEKQKN